jgi:hypothetical protein
VQIRVQMSGADQQTDPTHTKVSIHTFVRYTRFFRYGLMTTVLPFEANPATNGSSEWRSR